jgi:hypothetical protein
VRRVLPPHTRMLAMLFWDAHTRASPLARDAKHKYTFLNAAGVQEERGVQLQDQPDGHMYAAFVAEHGPNLVSERSFCTYGVCKPPWVKRLKNRFVCMSEKDTQVRLYIDALRALALRLQKLPKTCTCAPGSPGCAMHIAPLLEHTGTLRNAVLCAKKRPDEPFHRLKCLDGSCTVCGWARKLGSCSMLDSAVADASWRQFETVFEQRVGCAAGGLRGWARYLAQPLSNDARMKGNTPLTFPAGARVLEGNWLQQCAKPQSGDNVYELWDADWASNARGSWAAGKPPWKCVPTVVVRWDEVESTHITMRAATAADCAGMDRTAHPGKLFALPPAELEAIMSEFEV